MSHLSPRWRHAGSSERTSIWRNIEAETASAGRNDQTAHRTIFEREFCTESSFASMQNSEKVLHRAKNADAKLDSDDACRIFRVVKIQKEGFCIGKCGVVAVQN